MATKTPMEKDCKMQIRKMRATLHASETAVLCPLTVSVAFEFMLPKIMLFLGGASCLLGISPLGPPVHFFFWGHSLGVRALGMAAAEGNGKIKKEWLELYETKSYRMTTGKTS